MKLRIRGAVQIVQVVADGRNFLRGPEEMKHLAVLQGDPRDPGGLLSLVVDK